MHVIINNSPRSSRPKYLGFNDKGEHRWVKDRLDAIRFNNMSDAKDCCAKYLRLGAKVIEVDEFDGHYEAYNDYEIQIFKDDLRELKGGHRWRYRIGKLASGRAYIYTPGTLGYTTPGTALQQARNAVDSIKES